MGLRFVSPHALVMTSLFRSGSLSSKANDVLLATYTPRPDPLGCYVALYKAIDLHSTSHHSFIHSHLSCHSTDVGIHRRGLMFGRSSPITTQINMYVMSRVILWIVEDVGGERGDGRLGEGERVYGVCGGSVGVGDGHF